MRIELIAGYLAANNFGSVSESIFAYFMPSISTQAILVLPRAAGRIDVERPGWRNNDGFQVLVRGSDVQANVILAQQINDFLATEQNFTLPSYEGAPALSVYNVRPVNDPFVYPRDEAAVWEVSTNFTISYVIPE